jgi:ABC-type nitrate/sulfonate/bicarbonate transport system substrate-binding protein
MRCLSLLAGAALSAVLAFAPGAASAEAIKTRLAQNLSPISGVAIVAKRQGFFEKQGLDVAVSNFTSGKQALDTVIGGGADFATTAEAPITAAAMAGQPIAFLAGINASDVKTLTSAEAGVKTRADLKGKRIAYTAGTGGEVYTMQLLKSAGLTKADVTLVNLRPQEMLPALLAGSIDAFDTWEPHVSNAKKAMGDKAAELDTKGVYSETFNIVVTQPYLAANGETVAKFLSALIEAEGWIKANPDAAANVIAETVGMKPEDLKAIWSDYAYQVAIGPRQLDALKTHAEWRLESKNHPPGVTGLPDFSKVIFPEPLKKLDAARVTYPQS